MTAAAPVLPYSQVACPPPAGPRVVVTTDMAGLGDRDDWYDAVCGVALGVWGFVLDDGSSHNDYAQAALADLGGRVLDPPDLHTADVVVVAGAGTHAARHWRYGQRVILFAGDSHGLDEHNQRLDRAAYDFLRPRALWVPCFAGGLWQTDRRTASFVQTHDDVLLAGLGVAGWFDYWVPGRGVRNLWSAVLLRFAFTGRWRGHTFDGQAFRADPATLHDDMVSGTRELLAAVRP